MSYIEFGKPREEYFTQPELAGCPISEERKHELYGQFAFRISLGESPGQAREAMLVREMFRCEDEYELARGEFVETWKEACETITYGDGHPLGGV